MVSCGGPSKRQTLSCVLSALLNMHESGKCWMPLGKAAGENTSSGGSASSHCKDAHVASRNTQSEAQEMNVSINKLCISKLLKLLDESACRDLVPEDHIE